LENYPAKNVYLCNFDPNSLLMALPGISVCVTGNASNSFFYKKDRKC